MIHRKSCRLPRGIPEKEVGNISALIALHLARWKLQDVRLCSSVKDAPKRGGAAGLQPSPQTHKSWNLKNTDFGDIMISKVLPDLAFNRNQPHKSADD
jgi:hypothetical protein